MSGGTNVPPKVFRNFILACEILYISPNLEICPPKLLKMSPQNSLAKKFFNKLSHQIFFLFLLSSIHWRWIQAPITQMLQDQLLSASTWSGCLIFHYHQTPVTHVCKSGDPAHSHELLPCISLQHQKLIFQFASLFHFIEVKGRRWEKKNESGVCERCRLRKEERKQKETGGGGACQRVIRES